MRISDWSSDVCTSDLLIPSLPMARARRRIAAGAAVQRAAAAGVADAGAGAGDPAAGPAQSGDVRDGARAQGGEGAEQGREEREEEAGEIGAAAGDRKSTRLNSSH